MPPGTPAAASSAGEEDLPNEGLKAHLQRCRGMVLGRAEARVIGDEDPHPHPACGHDLSQFPSTVHDDLGSGGK
eukprot:4556519-Lingulodinium_polyedra.AAC.1